MMYDNDSIHGLDALERARLGSVFDCEPVIYRCDDCGRCIFEGEKFRVAGGDILCEECGEAYWASCERIASEEVLDGC